MKKSAWSESSVVHSSWPSLFRSSRWMSTYALGMPCKLNYVHYHAVNLPLRIINWLFQSLDRHISLCTAAWTLFLTHFLGVHVSLCKLYRYHDLKVTKNASIDLQLLSTISPYHKQYRTVSNSPWTCRQRPWEAHFHRWSRWSHPSEHVSCLACHVNSTRCTLSPRFHHTVSYTNYFSQVIDIYRFARPREHFFSSFLLAVVVTLQEGYNLHRKN